jgi:hypothetical protein
VAALRTVFYGGTDPLPGDPGLLTSVVVTTVFALAMLVAGTISVERRRLL